MAPHRAYQQQRVTSLPRVDVILGLYDQALLRTDRAAAALARHDQAGADLLVKQAQLAISGLVCANQGNVGELALTFLRLYDFVNRRLAQATPESLAAAARVLHTLREGFEAARATAVRLEREGVIPPLDQSPAVRVLA
jgi:flagellar biosynthetic protein FliS